MYTHQKAELLRRLSALQEEQDMIQFELGSICVPPPEDSDASLEEIAAFFRVNGFWVIRGAVSGEWLAQVQRVFTKAQGPARTL